MSIVNGYGGLPGAVERIRNGEIFWMKNKTAQGVEVLKIARRTKSHKLKKKKSTDSNFKNGLKLF